jgi:hypothetical protein
MKISKTGLVISTFLAGALLGLSSGVPASATTIPLTDSYSALGLPDFYIRTLTFNLPAGYTNASLNISTLQIDDRGVVELNGAIVASSGILTGNFQPQGQMILTAGGSPEPFTFQYDYFTTNFAAITTNFQTGLNTIQIIVNDTSGGLNFRNGLLSGGYYFLNGIQQNYGAPTSSLFEATVTFDLDPRVAQAPLPAALPLFASGLGALGFATYRKRRRTV